MDGREIQRIAVIGGSLTGLFCAAALVGDGREVTIVERDEYPVDPTPRRGVPQGAQTHVLLARGLDAAERLLPGIRAELEAAGAIAFDGGDLAMLTADGWLPTGGGGFELLTATRPLFEHVVRTRVLALPGVRPGLHEGRHDGGVRLDADLLSGERRQLGERLQSRDDGVGVVGVDQRHDGRRRDC